MKRENVRKTAIHLCAVLLFLVPLFIGCRSGVQSHIRIREDFNKGWTFTLGDIDGAENVDYDDDGWRPLDLPHDWSIEGEFSAENPATPGGGALPGGIGWYQKTFTLPESDKGKLVFIDFDGVYMNSDVWFNGRHLGHRPYGYISFRYELTPHLNYGEEKNILSVRVDNSLQPNSRWYSGCGIYRNVWLVKTDSTHVDHWGIFVTTPEVSRDSAVTVVQTTVRNASLREKTVTLKSTVFGPNGRITAEAESELLIAAKGSHRFTQSLDVPEPELWSVESPALYSLRTQVLVDDRIADEEKTVFGIRQFRFDAEKGFFLNDESLKILGVCNHHDLGCLGTAVNTRALERQLEILQAMGCNAIRTSHNPPAPELLDLCDRMGFIVMDEAFDMWRKKKTAYDYSLYYDEWHEQDLKDFIKRDRNHASVFIWSIGNEILEQWDSSGVTMARELAAMVRELDPTRPITSGCNDPRPHNYIIQSGALDLIGYNYHHQWFENFPETFPGQKFIAAETGSAIATRGSYDMPSDVVRRWPVSGDYKGPEPNDDYTCSAYDNCSVPWGSTHEETWSVLKKHDYLSGMFYWTGFDYLGEPTPYWWPARSSYFGLVDLAGFPKDAYWFYQSEWTDTPVLHVFPHWNWSEGDTVDVWVYTNYDEVELFLNESSLGMKKKTEDKLHLMWRVVYTPGTIEARATRSVGERLSRKICTAGSAAVLSLTADRPVIHADGTDLCFITVDVLDSARNIVPHADNLVEFAVDGPGRIAGVDNGNPVSHEPFKADRRKVFNGKCLVVVQSTSRAGTIRLKATSEGLQAATIKIATK